MRTFFSLFLISLVFIYSSCKDQQSNYPFKNILGNGEMPNLTKDNQGGLYLVYGNRDSIMYAKSVDHGKSFSKPALVAILPKLFASAMRGPQIAFSDEGVTILAASKEGNIYSYKKDQSGSWIKTTRINDIDTVAKEGLMALSGDRKILFAVWLDLRGNHHNKIVGAKSNDGGKNWSNNMVIYVSPDSTICECCKPSVVVKGNNIYVMFRNWLKGNRDLYLIQSMDEGNTFGEAKKLGSDSWALDGCPMDGGGLAIKDNGLPETIWRRKNKIYSCEPGQVETMIGEGRSCTIESINGKNVYAWTENGEVIVIKPQGQKTNLGKGQLPVIKSINNEHIICAWENEGQIHTAVLEL